MRDEYQAIVIGGGVSGLTAAALLAKRGVRVLVLEGNYMPGGACGAIRRRGVTFDMGAAMLFGFGDKGFAPHRFVMNELEEAIEVIRHAALYRLNYGQEPIVFWPERERFYRELDAAFPEHGAEIRAFYAFIVDLYENVIQTDPVFVSPSEMRSRDLLGQFLRRPIRQLRTLSLLSTSAGALIRRYVRSEEVIRFFNKLTSTYCYTTMDETPAILAATMFVDNHTGGSYYPVGSPAAFSGRLEKAIERLGGEILYETEATAILFDGQRVRGVRTKGGGEYAAPRVIYSGAVQNLYRTLLPPELVPADEKERIEKLAMTYPSVVLYGLVKAEAIPSGTMPVEMFVGNKERIDEEEVTIYISSLEEPNLCPAGKHCFTLIGPSFSKWPRPEDPSYRTRAYQAQKEAEAARLLSILERRFPGFQRSLEFWELGTPTTIERFLRKPGGSVAGPKQAIGQKLMKRPHARTRWEGLYLAGESTVMGTGTPAVTVSGISAADMVLRDLKKKEFRFYRQPRNCVTVLQGPVARRPAPEAPPHTASLCQWCETPFCSNSCPAHIDIRGILRRMEMGNFLGALRRLRQSAGAGPSLPCDTCPGRFCEKSCYRASYAEGPVPIFSNLGWLSTGKDLGVT